MRQRTSVFSRTALAAAALVALAGCAQFPGLGKPAATAPGAPTTGASAAPGAAPAPAPAAAPAAGGKPQAVPTAAARPGVGPSGAAPTPPAAPPAPGSLPPFDTVAKDARKTDALFGVWRKDDKIWLELRPEDFNKPFFLSPKLSQGIGEAGLYAGRMFGTWGNFGRPQIVEFRRQHNVVQLVALNTEFLAASGTPESRAVASNFSVSLLASAPVTSAPHAERKSVLIDAAPLFLSDMQGMGMQLQRTFRQGYSLDVRNSSVDAVRGASDLLVIEARHHFAVPSIAVPTPPPPGLSIPAGLPQPTTPRGLPDVRSLFLGLHYSFSKLPDNPMAPRLADPRLGHFTTVRQDFSKDVVRSPKVRYVNRWRLEKKDPAAELSEPVKPITFWLDKNIPLAYRGAITEGVLEWNKAFERIGFKNAVVVKQQADDATFDTLDVNVASLRWLINSEAQFGAIGPSQVDPRTGEILDADISFESLSSRSLRFIRSSLLARPAASGFTVDWAGLLQARDAQREGALPSDAAPEAHAHGDACVHGDQAAEQLAYALEVLESRGELDPDGPEVQRFVLDYLKDTTMHEVGHTLGLRHNFRSSRVYTEQQLSDEGFTRERGLAGSVMEYAPLNLPRPGEKGGTAFQLALGPYDYWAIEYAYRPLDPASEAAELRRIAARSAEPELAYATDEDSYIGIDPEALQFDLGDDPVRFARKRFEIGRDIIKRLDARPLKSEADYSVVRRSAAYAVRDMGRAAGILARQIGGMRTLRDFPGSGRDPLQPVAAPVQREALDTLAREVLSADSLRVSAGLRRKLAPDYFERIEGLMGGDFVSTDLALDDMVGQLRRAVLAQLMTDGVATRILDNEQKMPAGEAFRLSELYGRLTREIWSDLELPGDIPGPRRELQRDHVNRLASQLLRPAASRTDTRSLLRQEAQSLVRRLGQASVRKGLSPESRAHLEDSRETLDLALKARLQRVGL